MSVCRHELGGLTPNPGQFQPRLAVLWNGVSISSRFRDIVQLCSKRIGVTSLTFQLIAHMLFPIGGSLEPSLYLYRFPNSEIFNVICNAMVDVTLKRPLNKGQGHSFWYQ